MRQIIFYKKKSGETPVEEFLDKLSSKQVRKVVWVLKLVEEFQEVPLEYLKKIAGSTGIWEIRINFAGDSMRILGFIRKGSFVILTNGFFKKSKKTPKNEKEKAERRKSDYLARYIDE